MLSSLRHQLAVVSSVNASSMRLWNGTNAFEPAPVQPEQLLELYEFEACPFCRLVREALTELDLDVLIRPCPKGGTRYRPQVRERGGRSQYPYLVDPNTGIELYESADIVAYLYRSYGKRPVPAGMFGRPAALLESNLASAMRPHRGHRAGTGRLPDQLLELYSFESSPYSRLVRELLCELEIPYILRNSGKAMWRDWGPPTVKTGLFPNAPTLGRNRTALQARTGKVQFPYLIDPNTGEEMFESAEICAYLRRTYA